jgi:hypothetical protein
LDVGCKTGKLPSDRAIISGALTMAASEINTMLTLTHATERDVDLLLVEELKCSSAFINWLVDRVSTDVGKAFVWQYSSVTHSKRRLHSRREIDITLELECEDGPTIFLVENKLDTAPQPRQAESYLEEAVALVTDCDAQAAYTVLVAPEAYFVSASEFAAKFNSNISYEEVSKFIGNQSNRETGELSVRLKHKQALLDQAITKARRGYEVVPMVEIDAFNAKYVSLLRDYGVSLEPGPSMLKEGRPGESHTIIFATTALPKWPFLPQTRLVHQLREGNANINFYGWGRFFTILASVIAADLHDTPYRPVPTVNKRVGGKSGLMLVVDTPPIDNLKSFEEQRDQILQGARITAALRDWFVSNETAIERWATVAASL